MTLAQFGVKRREAAGRAPALAVLCEYSSISDSGRLNLLGIFNTVIAPTLPHLIPQMFIVTVYEVPTTTPPVEPRPLKVRLLDPSGQELFNVEQSVRLARTGPPSQAGIAMINLVTGLGGLQFPSAGDYTFEVNWGEEGPTAIPLTIQLPQEESDAARDHLSGP